MSPTIQVNLFSDESANSRHVALNDKEANLLPPRAPIWGRFDRCCERRIMAYLFRWGQSLKHDLT